MKYKFGMYEDCYIDVNGNVHIPFPDEAQKRAQQTIGRVKMWRDGSYVYHPNDAMSVLYGYIAELEKECVYLNGEIADIVNKYEDDKPLHCPGCDGDHL